MLQFYTNDLIGLSILETVKTSWSLVVKVSERKMVNYCATGVEYLVFSFRIDHYIQRTSSEKFIEMSVKISEIYVFQLGKNIYSSRPLYVFSKSCSPCLFLFSLKGQ